MDFDVDACDISAVRRLALTLAETRLAAIVPAGWVTRELLADHGIYEGDESWTDSRDRIDWWTDRVYAALRVISGQSRTSRYDPVLSAQACATYQQFDAFHVAKWTSS